MLTEIERERFHALRDRRDRGATLSESETAEVARFVEQIEAREAAYLMPATQRLQEQNAATEARIQAAHRLTEKEARFARRLEQTLRELQTEREILRGERQRIFAETAA